MYGKYSEFKYIPPQLTTLVEGLTETEHVVGAKLPCVAELLLLTNATLNDALVVVPPVIFKLDAFVAFVAVVALVALVATLTNEFTYPHVKVSVDGLYEIAPVYGI